MRFIESQRVGGERPKASRTSNGADMQDRIVCMDAFHQILALDEADITREFSKTLVWAWCDQAEVAIEDMERSLKQNNIVDAASKAHYLKGSSASLGLLRVSKTCQSIYHLHFPPSLAHFRSFSYSSSDYSSSMQSSGDSSSSSSSGSSGVPSPPLAMGSPGYSPLLEKPAINFDTVKIDRAEVLLRTLKKEIQEASEWLCKYYSESDKYSAGPT